MTVNLEDSMQFDAVGFSPKAMTFENNYFNTSFSTTINNDNLEFENKRNLSISSIMTYMRMNDFYIKIIIYFYVENLLIVVAIILYIKRNAFLKLIKKNTIRNQDMLKWLCVAGPMIGAFTIHLLKL